eukprot:5501007-Prymnesium_polylepis.1
MGLQRGAHPPAIRIPNFSRDDHQGRCNRGATSARAALSIPRARRLPLLSRDVSRAPRGGDEPPGPHAPCVRGGA